MKEEPLPRPIVPDDDQMSEREAVDAARILHGVKWTYAGAILRVIAQLGIAAVLARLLVPGEFGLVALGMVVIRFAKYFADTGIAGAIVQQQQMEPEDIGAAFLLTVLLGGAFFFLVYFTSPLIAQFYENPDLTAVLQLLATGFIISGFSTVSQGLLRRALRFKYLSLAETFSYVIGYGVVGIGLAINGQGVFSLVGAFLSQSTILLLLCYASERHTLMAPLHLSPYRRLLGFGSRYSLLNFLTFMTSSLDHFVIGKFYPSATLGLYDRSKHLVFLPTYNILISLTQVLFPSYSALQEDTDRLRSLFLRGMLITGFLLLPVSAGIIAAAEQIVAVLLGPQWDAAVPLVKIFAVYVPIDLMTSVGATLCSATRQLKSQLHIQLFSLLLLVAGMTVAVNMSIEHIALWIALVYWLRFALYMNLVRRVIQTKWFDHFRLHAGQIAAAIWVFACIYTVSHSLQGLTAPLLLPIQVLTGAASLGVFVLFSPFSGIRAAIRQIFEVIGLNRIQHPTMTWLIRRFAR
jgi:O-antigen/teichoic acid export membrane protein